MIKSTKLIENKLFKAGFNLFGSCKISDYNNLVDDKYQIKNDSYKNIILIGSGGRYFWDILQKYISENNFISPDPIDDYTLYALESIQKKYSKFIGDCFYPFKNESLLINFQKLALCTNIGFFSPYLKLILNLEYGSYISLRAAFLTNYSFKRDDGIKKIFCETCDKPCLNVCPVQAVNINNFDLKKCAEYRLEEKDCSNFCHVRRSCILGQEHIYSSQEGFHRSKSSLKIIKEYYDNT